MLAKDLNGKEVLTAYAPIEPAREQAARGGPASPLGWKVFVEQPVSEVYAALDATILRTVVLIVAGLLFSAMAALWLARNMVRPISVLQEGAQRIGAGDLEQKIDIRTGDELEALAGQFNRMTEQLRESYAGLERKVEERTAELQQSLERQTATAEILKVISSTPTNVQPVFDAIVRNAVTLCDAMFASAFRYDGEMLHFLATTSVNEEFLRTIRDVYPIRPDRSQISGRAILTRSLVRLEDALADPEYNQRHAVAGDWRRMLGVPLLRDGNPIGVIVVGWKDAGPIPPVQEQLLKTFADQAVIAIENVRLFNETKESLEQQTATSEILKVISSSPIDTQAGVRGDRAKWTEAVPGCAGLGRASGGRRGAARRGGGARPGSVRAVAQALPVPAFPVLYARRGAPRWTHARRGRRCGNYRARACCGSQELPRKRAACPDHHADAARRRGDRRDQRGAPRSRALERVAARAAAYLRRPGGDRDRERAAVQRDQGIARAADGDERDFARDLGFAGQREADPRRGGRARDAALRLHVDRDLRP